MSTWNPFTLFRNWLRNWLGVADKEHTRLRFEGVGSEIDENTMRFGPIHTRLDAGDKVIDRMAGKVSALLVADEQVGQRLLAAEDGLVQASVDDAEHRARHLALATYVQLQHSSCSAVRSVLGVPATAQPCRLRPGTLPVPCTLEGCPQRAIHGRLEELMQEALGASGEG